MLFTQNEKEEEGKKHKPWISKSKTKVIKIDSLFSSFLSDFISIPIYKCFLRAVHRLYHAFFSVAFVSTDRNKQMNYGHSDDLAIRYGTFIHKLFSIRSFVCLSVCEWLIKEYTLVAYNANIDFFAALT